VSLPIIVNFMFLVTLLHIDLFLIEYFGFFFFLRKVIFLTACQLRHLYNFFHLFTRSCLCCHFFLLMQFVIWYNMVDIFKIINTLKILRITYFFKRFHWSLTIIFSYLYITKKCLSCKFISNLLCLYHIFR
jgi:hypothetical protein